MKLTFGIVKGGGVPRFQKFGEAPYGTVVPLHTESFSTLAPMEKISKSGELKYEEK